jgi:hypothetical protein
MNSLEISVHKLNEGEAPTGEALGYLRLKHREGLSSYPGDVSISPLLLEAVSTAALRVLELGDIVRDFRIWFVIANPTWIPDSRLARYRRMWKGGAAMLLGDDAKRLPQGGVDAVLASENGIRSVGLVEIARALADWNHVVKVNHASRSFSAIFLSKRVEPEERLLGALFDSLFAQEGARSDIDLTRFASARCSIGDLVVRTALQWEFGQASLDLIGRYPLITSLRDQFNKATR